MYSRDTGGVRILALASTRRMAWIQLPDLFGLRFLIYRGEVVFLGLWKGFSEIVHGNHITGTWP